MSLKPYPEYKESGVDWLGDIPVNWSVKPLFSVASENRRSNKKMVEQNLLSLSYGRIIHKDISSNEGLLPESFETYQVIETDDLIFRLTDLQNDKRSLRSGLATERGIITSAYLSVRSKNILPRFFAYAMRDADLQKVFYSMGGGLRQSIKYDDMKRLAVVVPPADEQLHIANFLETETAEIDSFIRDQEELVFLLRERRTATITRAVTKGLTPGAPMKDSGVSWLGEVPAHWSLSKLGHHYEVVLGKMLDGAKEAPIGARVLPYIRAGNIQDSGLDLSDVNEMAYTPYEAERLDLIAKDLLVVEGGSVGTVHYLDSAMDGWSFQKTVNRVRSLGTADTKYLGNLIRTFRDSGVFEVICNGSTIMHLTAEKLRALTIPVPTVDEQRSIAAFIDRETEEIDAAIEEARIAIALSKERRAAVISAAVTGKIDVRDVASRTSTNKVGAESVGVA